MTSRLAVLTAMVCALSSGSATAQTFLRLDSQPGDVIGGGQPHLVTTANGAFTIQREDGGLILHVNDGGAFDLWQAYFNPPAGATVAAGLYEDVAFGPIHSPLVPGLYVNRPGVNYCSGTTGRFTVLEIATDPGGNVTALAVDFEQHCNGDAPALFGALRVNSAVPVAVRASISGGQLAEGDASATDLTFHVSLSAPSTGLVTAGFESADATATSGSDYQAVAGTVTFAPGQTSAALTVPVLGDVAIEGDETFLLRFAGVTGVPVAFGQGSVLVRDDDAEKSLLFVDGDLGDYVSQGAVRRFTVGDSAFTAVRTFDQGVKVSLANAEGWDTTFAAPNGAPLTPGTYPVATRWPFQAAGVAGLDVNGDHRGCNELTGRFVVHEAVYGPGGVVERFAADLEQACEFFVRKLYGAVRYRSTIPLHVVTARPRQATEDAGSVNVDFLLAWPQPDPVVVTYATAPGTATSPGDYLPASGTVTFPPATVTLQRPVAIVSDRVDEVAEAFDVALSGPTGAQTLRTRAGVDIIDDDPRFPFQAAHGLSETRALYFPTSLEAHRYRIEEQPLSSYEVVVDAVSGDLGGNGVEGIGLTVSGPGGAHDSEPVGLGPSRSLRWQNESTSAQVSEVSVSSSSCDADCGFDDTYRIRVYDTTYSGARFNNTAGQRTVLILQNPTNGFVQTTAWFWKPDGTLTGLGWADLQAHASVVIDTSALQGVADTSGSVTVTHTAPYGALAGKTVSVDPSAGITFDTPLVPRPR